MSKAELTPEEYARGCLYRITNDPTQYDQETWQSVAESLVSFPPGESHIEVSCQTTGCVAGTASMLAGDKAIIEKHYADVRRVKGVQSYIIGKVITQSGKRVDISERGRQLLNLDHSDSAWLFCGDRTVPEVVQALRELMEGNVLSRRTESEMNADEIAELKAFRLEPPKAAKKVKKVQQEAKQKVAQK